jgi:hypothetical protein
MVTHAQQLMSRTTTTQHATERVTYAFGLLAWSTKTQKQFVTIFYCTQQTGMAVTLHVIG